MFEIGARSINFRLFVVIAIIGLYREQHFFRVDPTNVFCALFHRWVMPTCNNQPKAGSLRLCGDSSVWHRALFLLMPLFQGLASSAIHSHPSHHTPTSPSLLL